MSESDATVKDSKFHGSFEKYNEFVELQKELLSVDVNSDTAANEDVWQAQRSKLQKLEMIFREYHEQSYLLDPVLEQLADPAISVLRDHVKKTTDLPDQRVGEEHRLKILADLLYAYITFRGYKTILRFFPHTVTDLPMVIQYMQKEDSPAQARWLWPLRYEMLLWLSLLCMIPFDLAQFDEAGEANQTADSIESLAKLSLDKAGLECDAAALVLSRFYMRKDTLDRFHIFLDWTQATIEGPYRPFTVIGLLRVLCEVCKSGPWDAVQPGIPKLLQILNAIEGLEALSSNNVLRKFRSKLLSRVALRLLPTEVFRTRRIGRVLVGSDSAVHHHIEDVDVPEEVEDILAKLFEALQDRDTVVRYSAAKGVARIAERLPSDFADQVLDTVMGHFAIHSVAAASMYDLPAIAESTWHGASLACAEMARRDLIEASRLSELIGWLLKALYFDLRKGSHSIGSNVRDAAAYVLWALARTHSPADLQPYAETLAGQLVAVSLYDREVHIRRAASAAFQEFVGRTSLFPHGIDTLRKTDFYAVSIRRNAFLLAAPQVAEHLVYRKCLFDHLLNVTLRHWDITLRRLGAESLKLICLQDLTLVPGAISRTVILLESPDLTDLHGALLALTELSKAHSTPEDGQRRKQDIFKYIARIPEAVLLGPRNELVTAAACDFIATTITAVDINSQNGSSTPYWRKVLDYGLKHRITTVQESAASAISTVSKLVDCYEIVSRLIRELKTGSFPMQQSLGRILGVIDYDTYPKCLQPAIECLLECVKTGSPMQSNVEARQNCYTAISLIFLNVQDHLAERLTAKDVNVLYDVLLAGLEDYSIDERGDVGSWIRMACIRGLATVNSIVLAKAQDLPDFAAYLPPDKYQAAVAGILKQGVERLDNVRQEAGQSFLKILDLPTPSVERAKDWEVYQASLFRELFYSEEETGSWIDGGWLYPRALQILRVKEYRKAVLTGLIMSIGSKTEMTRRPLAAALVVYVESIPVVSLQSDEYSMSDLLEDITKYAKTSATSNSIFIPILQTFNILLEADAVRKCQELDTVIQNLSGILLIASRNIERIKNTQRIQEAMKLVVNLLSFSKMFDQSVAIVPKFLCHQYPTVRSTTAEYLYLTLQSQDVGRETDEIEDVILETEWSSTDMDSLKEATDRIMELFGVSP